MKPRIITMAAVMGLIVALSAGELLAAGQGSGGGKGMQMRTTANGSTTRPGNGKGLQDGSRLNTSTAPVTAQ